jgi:hypothetical protein
MADKITAKSVILSGAKCVTRNGSTRVGRKMSMEIMVSGMSILQAKTARNHIFVQCTTAPASVSLQRAKELEDRIGNIAYLHF